MKEINVNKQALKRNLLDLKELHHILEKTAIFFREAELGSVIGAVESGEEARGASMCVEGGCMEGGCVEGGCVEGGCVEGGCVVGGCGGRVWREGVWREGVWREGAGRMGGGRGQGGVRKGEGRRACPPLVV